MRLVVRRPFYIYTYRPFYMLWLSLSLACYLVRLLCAIFTWARAKAQREGEVEKAGERERGGLRVCGECVCSVHMGKWQVLVGGQQGQGMLCVVCVSCLWGVYVCLTSCVCGV